MTREEMEKYIGGPLCKELYDKLKNIYDKGYQDCNKALEQEPKTGRWIDGFCSKCGEEAITEWNDIGGELCLSDYCPNCGAKMIESKEREAAE